MSTIDIKDELKEKERKTREKTIVQRFKTLQIKRNGISLKFQEWMIRFMIMKE